MRPAGRACVGEPSGRTAPGTVALQVPAPERQRDYPRLTLSPTNFQLLLTKMENVSPNESLPVAAIES